MQLPFSGHGGLTVPALVILRFQRSDRSAAHFFKSTLSYQTFNIRSYLNLFRGKGDIDSSAGARLAALLQLAGTTGKRSFVDVQIHGTLEVGQFITATCSR